MDENGAVLFKGMRETAANLSEDGQFSSWDLNPGTPEYEAEFSNILSRFSMFAVCEIVLPC